MRAPPTVRLGHTLSIDNRGSEIETYSLVHEKANKMYSPANAHAVFSIQTVRPCTGLLFVIAENSPVAWFCSCPIFCQLRFFGNVIHLRPKTFAAKKPKKTEVRTRVQISGSISQKRRGHLVFCAQK